MSMTYAVSSDLTDEEAYLLSILQDHSGLDLMEFSSWDGSSDDGCWRAWSFQWSWWRTRAPLQIDCCVAGGQLVLTDRGHVPIEDITVGTNVLTHRGRWRPVTGVFDRGARPVVEVRGQGHPGLVVTDDHPIYARRSRRASRPKDGHKGKKLLESEWLAPSQWEWNDGSGKMHANWGTPAIIDATELPPQLEGAYRSGQQNFVDDLWTEAWMWLYGLYIAEGSSYVDAPGKGLVHRSVWSVNHTELAEVAAWLSKAGLNWSSTRKGEVEPIHVNSKPVTLWLIEHAGKLAPNKRLATWVFALPEVLRRAVFDGLTFGDGHWRNGRWSYTTVSRALAIEIRLLGLSLGETVSIYKPKHHPEQTIQGRSVKCHQKYVVDFQPLLGQRRRHMQTIEGTAWAPVKRIVDHGVAPVYDLEVAEDHSFVVEGIAVHNCARSVGKSLSILARMYAFPFRRPGQEAVITAPELIHLEPIINLIENQWFATRLGREMMQKGRSGVTHRPFMMNFRNGARIMGRIPQRDGKGVKGCVCAGTPVLTDKGFVSIEELQAGDMVLTHRGRWRPVERVETDVADCFQVRGAGSYAIEVSSDHRFFGAENLATPKQRRRFTDLGFHDVEFLLEHQVYWATPTSFPRLPVPQLEYEGPARHLDQDTDAFWWLVGAYLANGWTTAGTKVEWCLPAAKQPALYAALRKLGLPPWKKERDHSDGDVITIASRPWNRWLDEHFGHLAAHKRVPPWVFGMFVDDREALLDGYLAGDGWFEPKKKRTEVGSASRNLAMGIQMVAQSLGYTVGCTVVQPKVTAIAGTTLKKKPELSWRLHIGHGHSELIDDHLVGKVKSVTPIGKQTVYNPIVADDHSYISSSIVSHNIHPLQLELDEAQDYVKRGWTELNETLKRGFEGAEWRAHGVTRGVRDKFYEYTQDKPNNPWKVHHYSAMWRPNWTDEERTAAIAKYGGHRDDPDYRRNVLGQHGDPTAALFVVTRLYSCVDDDESSDYNQHEYSHLEISDAMVEELGPGGNVADLLTFPDKHREYEVTWAGQDVGLTHDPSEILVFGEYHPSADERKAMSNRKKACPKTGISRFKLLTRVSLKRVANPDQIRLILAIIAFYRPKAYGLDKTGIGLPLYQDLLAMIREEGEFSAEAQAAANIIKGYNFAAKVIVDIDDNIEIDEYEGDQVRDAGIHRNVLEQSTDKLRDYVDQERLWLPWDDQLLAEFEGQTFSYSKSAIDQFGRPRRIFSEGRFHALDAARMFAMAHSQQAIEAIVNAKDDKEAVIDRFYQPGM